jgi:phosphate transport system protein
MMMAYPRHGPAKALPFEIKPFTGSKMIIRRTFEEQLNELQNDMLRLGRFVEEALGKAMDALVRQDLVLAKQVIADDDFADDMTFGIQARTMQCWPCSSRWRATCVLSAPRCALWSISNALAIMPVTSPKSRAVWPGQTFFKPLVDIPQLGELARKMVGDSLQSFVSHDTDLAVQVARDDDAVDDLCDRLQNELMEKMRNDPSLVEQATRLLLVARMLERVADHATNIVENIYYVGNRRNAPTGPRRNT